MSLSSIMSSGADSEPHPKTQPSSLLTEPPLMPKASLSNIHPTKQEPIASPIATDIPMQDNVPLPTGYNAIMPVANGRSSGRLMVKEIPVPDESAVEAELARIETAEMSDIEGPGFEQEKKEYLQRGKKRGLEIEAAEVSKRKVR